MVTGSFLGLKSGRGVTLTPHPLLVPLVMKEYSCTFTSPMGGTACTEPHGLYKGELYFYFNFYFSLSLSLSLSLSRDVTTYSNVNGSETKLKIDSFLS
jgi:hypothetical protein